MISFTIDTSVFALKPKDDDPEKESENIQQFVSNMFYLRRLEECPSVTVSYMNWTVKRLLEHKLMPKDLKPRIEEAKKSNPIDNYDVDLINFFNDIYGRIRNYSETDKKTQEKKIRKGKIGIYENIPDRDSDPDIKYRNISYTNKIYPFDKKKSLSNLYKQYLGYIAELNDTCFSECENYVVIGGDMATYQENVGLGYNNFKESKVNIVGIQKTDAILPKMKLRNVTDAFNEITNIKDSKIAYGQGVTLENVKQNMGFDGISALDKDKNNEVSESYFSIKLVYYMKTLNNIAAIIRDREMSDREWELFTNAHGCICSPDSGIYEKCPLKTRHFKNSLGHAEYFSLHMKPITFRKKNNLSELTRRIYFRQNGNQMLVGHIGKHLLSCGNKEPDCVKANCPYIPSPNH